MKKIIIAIATVLGLGSVTSCSDMLETDSSRQMFDPELDDKTDSVFYSYGILQAMQQLADQYVFQGEMRGELAATTFYTDKNLRELANFSATTANKYDSAYVYYRVINNCNYYIAHRDTTLLTGATEVVMNEYSAVKAIRAWAYLQLAKNYGKVPFFTEPLTKISQINNGNFPELDMASIVGELAPDLAQYSGLNVPLTGQDVQSIGRNNRGGTKQISLQHLFIPVDVVLGDMYLEVGNYSQAAHHYTVYLTEVSTTAGNMAYGEVPTSSILNTDMIERPSDFKSVNSGVLWRNIFQTVKGSDDLITYIPMAVNRLMGTTTEVPNAFGFDYYATSNAGYRIDEIQLVPSQAYKALSDSCDYYYYSDLDKENKTIKSVKLGDCRMMSIMEERLFSEDSVTTRINKYSQANIILYRNTTVWLRLAEAFNRMGHSDIAFAILKDGISQNILDYAPYMTEESKQLLQTTYPLLSPTNIEKFPLTNSGIHARGCGLGVSDVGGQGFAMYYPYISPYQMKDTLNNVVGKKMKEIADVYGVTVGTTKQDTINAIEDMLCDEYALEFAFEGTRFGDLTRIARHKNRAGLYDANFGGKWFAKKLEANKPVKDLTIEQNWYLPFK